MINGKTAKRTFSYFIENISTYFTAVLVVGQFSVYNHLQNMLMDPRPWKSRENEMHQFTSHENKKNSIFHIRVLWFMLIIIQITTVHALQKGESLPTPDHRPRLCGTQCQWATFPHMLLLQTNPWAHDHRLHTPESPLAGQSESSGRGWPAQNIITRQKEL